MDVEKEEKKEKHSEISLRRYTCKQCGVVFDTSKKDVDVCVLCGEQSLDSEDCTEERSLQMFPFVKTEGDVEHDLRKKTWWNPLIPWAFKNKKNYSKIQKVYLPAILTNMKQDGRIVFLGGDRQTVIRDGKRTNEIKKYEIYYLVNFDYKNIFLNHSTKISGKLFSNICNYDYDLLEEFDSTTLKDAVCVLGDVSATEIGDKERERVAKYSLLKVRNQVNHNLKKLKNDDTKIEFYDAKEVLLPVYIVTISYRKKNYTYYMNGQNGDSYFFIPTGIIETILLSVLICASVFVITFFLTKLL